MRKGQLCCGDGGLEAQGDAEFCSRVMRPLGEVMRVVKLFITNRVIAELCWNLLSRTEASFYFSAPVGPFTGSCCTLKDIFVHNVLVFWGFIQPNITCNWLSRSLGWAKYSKLRLEQLTTLQINKKQFFFLFQSHVPFFATQGSYSAEEVVGARVHTCHWEHLLACCPNNGLRYL